ncbi:MAG: hypothetical protein ACI3Z7_06670 [Candidatus Aphodosoma sp.]
MESEIESNLFNETVRIFSGAVALGFADAVQAGGPIPDTEFQKALAENVEVFSAFRTHRMQNDIARLMTDERGVLKSFPRFARDVQPYVSHRNRAWLRTEYSTAVLRAAQASEWKQFEAEKDVLPNLRWVPSTSPDPGADRRVFWNTVRPIGDRFWSQHRPSDRWNCKCDLEPTDEPSTAVPSASGKRDEPSPGLENNPGKDGRLFSRRHPYFPKSCAACPFNPQPKLFALFADLAAQKDCEKCKTMLDIVSGRKQRLSEYSEKEWEHTYTPKGSTGFVVTQRERIEEAGASKAEKKKFEKELRMCKVIADNGHVVEYLRGVNRPAGQTYDILMDGIKSDLKCIDGGAGNIVKYAKKALTEQGGEAVIFELPNADVKYFDVLSEARRKCNGKIFFYVKNENIIKEVK